MAAGDKIQLVTLAELQAQVTALTDQVKTLLVAQGIPAGGTAGQILTKQTEEDYAAVWLDPANGGVPSGGTAGQALIKASDQAQDVTWGNLPAGVPAGGATGQVLKKLSETDGDTGWGDESGGSGAGVQSLEQTTTSTESGGVNVWTATLEDGSQSTLEVRNGQQGNAGAAATVAVGNVGYGTTPNVSNSGDEHNAVLDFTLPMTTVENAQVYSQEETVIGTWINGKPIYRRTYLMTTPSTAGQHTMLDTTSLNIDILTKPIECTLQAISGVDGCKLDSSFYGSNYTSSNMTSANTFVVCIMRNELLLSLGSGNSNRFGQPVTITIEYTKTTDEATVAVASMDELNSAYDEGVQSA